MNLKISTLYVSQKDFMREKVLEAFPQAQFNPLDRHLKPDELVEFFSDADAVIVGMDPMTAEVMDQLPKLKMIAKFGVGLDNIDLEAAKERDIQIGWTGGVNRRSVAEQALCFMLGLQRNIFRNGFALKKGQWIKNGGFELSGKTVGIVGCGHIGSELIKLLQPFQCNILIHDILDKQDLAAEYGAKCCSFKELLTHSDIVTLHVPLTEATHGMIDQNALHEMQNHAYLINTSRGEVVKQNDLKTALIQETIAGAALDVFESEPPTDLEFLDLPNLIPTPHICGNSREAVHYMLDSALEALKNLEE